MSGNMSERREFIRVPFNTEVEIQAEGLTVRSGTGIDICMTGLRLTVEHAVPPAGATCGVKIILAASEPRVVIEARGTIVRSDPGSLSVTFLELDLDSYHHLRQLILNNTDEPKRAEREFFSHWGIRRPRP
jgi:c-di-GMP-binding flagellar brake protein YcgR